LVLKNTSGWWHWVSILAVVECRYLQGQSSGPRALKKRRCPWQRWCIAGTGLCSSQEAAAAAAMPLSNQAGTSQLNLLCPV